MEQIYGRDVNREPELVQRKISKELQELDTAIRGTSKRG